MIKKEYLVAGILALVVLFLSNAYLLVGWGVPKDKLSYLGRRVTNSQDTYTYVSFIEQGRQGKVLFSNLYTTEPQTSTLIRPSYTVLGGAARVMGISSIEAYHLGRLIFTSVFFIVLYIFLKLFFHTSKRRLLAFMLILTSSGLGYLLMRIFPESSDLWIPESITFLSTQEAPHFVLSQTLMLLAFIFLLKGWAENKTRYFVYSFMALIFLGLEHPYNLLICAFISLITGLYLWRVKKISLRLFMIGTGSSFLGFFAGFGYQFLETLRNPTLGSWAAESSSPTPLNYIIGFGLLTFFALFGIEAYLRRRSNQYVLILSWIAAGSILMYAPVFFQRRLSEGFHIPLAMLAAEGIIIISIYLSQFALIKARNVVSYTIAIFFVFILTIGTIVGVYKDIAVVSGDNLNSYYYYLLTDEMKGMEWLRDNTKPDDAVLANWFYGNVLPGIAGRTTYVGHKAQTKNFDEKVDKINKFLVNKNTTESLKFLKENGIKYIYIGKNDSMLRYGFKPAEKPYLEKVFDDGEAKIYKVK